MRFSPPELDALILHDAHDGSNIAGDFFYNLVRRIGFQAMMHVPRFTLGAVRLVVLFIGSSLVSHALGAEPSATVRDEIQHLLTNLERSGCQFFRNGEWYGAAKAKDHLNQKYNYLLKKGLVRKSEDFIRLAATESSVSGKAYQVRCKGTEPMPSAVWLNEELSRYREQGRAKK